MTTAATPPQGDGAGPEAWRRITARYRTSDNRIALFQLANTLVPYFGLLALMGWSLRGPYAVTLLLAVPAGLLLTRCFVLFHDCGHASLFRGERANRLVGLALGLVVWESYHYWQHAHAMHHATSGHLGRRGVGDYDTWTVDEYLAQPRRRRLTYRVLRHPLFLFVVLPCFKFVAYNRLRPHPAPPAAWRSVPLTNLALLVVYGGAAAVWGWRDVLLVLAPVLWTASLVGLWLFYVQHQFENAYWARADRWTWHDAAMLGSSYYRLPRWLDWCTAGIAYHHIHHLSPRIPNYRLATAHRNEPLLQNAPTLTLRQSLATLRCHLWDEAAGRMVSFASLKGRAAPA